MKILSDIVDEQVPERLGGVLNLFLGSVGSNKVVDLFKVFFFVE
jgi:hypothetical protein